MRYQMLQISRWTKPQKVFSRYSEILVHSTHVISAYTLISPGYYVHILTLKYSDKISNYN